MQNYRHVSKTTPSVTGMPLLQDWTGLQEICACPPPPFFSEHGDLELAEEDLVA